MLHFSIKEWYRYGYSIWFTIGSCIICLSWIIQWLYCTWNCNDYLQYLLQRRRQSLQAKDPFAGDQHNAFKLKKIIKTEIETYIKTKQYTLPSSPKFFKSTLKKSIIVPNNELYVNTTRHEEQFEKINAAQTIDLMKTVYVFDDENISELSSDIAGNVPWRTEFWRQNGSRESKHIGPNISCDFTHNRCMIFTLFIVKGLFHLCHGGIFETYFINIYKLKKKIYAPFIDLCNLHILFQSLPMMAIVFLFCCNELFFNENHKLHKNYGHDDESPYYVVLFVQLLSFILSFISSCIITVNFEKFRYIPLYNAESWQFSKHNIVAIYVLFTGDFFLRFFPIGIFITFYYILWNEHIDIDGWIENGIFVTTCCCIFIQLIVTFIYHTICWYKWGFLPREVWVYEHKPYLSYQILNPVVNILDISPILGSFLRQFLFIYGAFITSNISIIGHIYYRPVVTKKLKHPRLVTKFVRYECFIRYCTGVVILLLIGIQGSYYNNDDDIDVPKSIESMLKLDTILIVLSFIFLLMTLILIYNLADTPTFHIDLFHDHHAKNRFNRHLYHNRNDTFDGSNSDGGSDWSDTQRSSYLMLSRDDDNDDEQEFYLYNGEVPTLPEHAPHLNSNGDSNKSMRRFIDTHKPTEINCFLKCLIKLTFSTHNLNKLRSDIQPWSSFAMYVR